MALPDIAGASVNIVSGKVHVIEISYWGDVFLIAATASDKTVRVISTFASWQDQIKIGVSDNAVYIESKGVGLSTFDYRVIK